MVDYQTIKTTVTSRPYFGDSVGFSHEGTFLALVLTILYKTVIYRGSNAILSRD
jgi:hypothetical protein